jgi:hypothetical protein
MIATVNLGAKTQPNQYKNPPPNVVAKSIVSLGNKNIAITNKIE